MNHQEHEQYIALFLLFSEKIEKGLKRGLAILAIGLLVIQVAMQWTPVRLALSRIDRLEGVPYYVLQR